MFENEIISAHKIMCPPNIAGEVVKIYGGGTDGKDLFHVDEPVMEVYNEAQDKTHVLHLSHFWPVRKPRPCAEKLPANQALTTGLRVVDAIYPSVLGGTCAVPGAFGCGKTVISQSLAKFSNSDAIVYVGCGKYFVLDYCARNIFYFCAVLSIQKSARFQQLTTFTFQLFSILLFIR